MNRGFGLRVLVVMVVLAVCCAFSVGVWGSDTGSFDAMKSGQIPPPMKYTDGWFIEYYYMDADTCNVDSLQTFIDTLYTNWVYAGPNWEIFWLYFSWYASDTGASVDTLDSLKSVTVQGCVDPVNFPTTIDYSYMWSYEANTAKGDTFTDIGYHPLDSLGVDPSYPYVRTQIIFEYAVDIGWCTDDTLEGSPETTHDKELFELRYKFQSVY